MLQYAVQQLDSQLVVPNPACNNKTYHLGKLREKIARRKAVLYDLQEKNLNDDLDKANHYLDKQLEITEQLHQLQARETELLDQRSRIPSRIKIKDMDERIRYNKLHTVSKRFQNMIKMICYRAETSCANLLSSGFEKSLNEKRALVKSIIFSHGDILPDYTNNTLTVSIYSQANPRMNHALEKTLELLNQTETIYPGTNLMVIYKIAT